MNGERNDVYARVTAAILRAMWEGVKTCEMPWHHKADMGLPRNAATKNAYHGINTLSLWAEGDRLGYASPYWASYRQWQSLGAQVRRDEHGSFIVFCKKDEKGDQADGDDEENKEKGRPFLLRHSFVFNSAQVEGWSPPNTETSDLDTLSTVDEFVAALGSDIRYGSTGASYNPILDRILMPHRRDFRDTAAGSALEGFCAVLLHEHIHWSGHPSRLNRILSGRFGSDAYAMEELVAELGAAFLCATLGISTYPREDHAAYVADWLSVLTAQKRAIFVAASAASVASEFLEALSERSRSAEST